MPKYSIITPVYNSYSLMEKYFRSLEEQSLKDFEVLLIDDCSNDDSYEKLCAYAKNTSLQMSIFRSDINRGPGNARNIGMEKASGEWITFIDNDDWVETNFLESIDYIICSNTDVNCVIFDYSTIDEKGKVTRAHSMYSGETGIIPVSKCMVYARNHTIGKFYKLSNCRKQDIKFPELRRCEDVAFVARAIDACEPVYYYKESLYYYYQRSGSLSNNTKLDESDMIRAFSILEQCLGEKYPEEIKEKSVTDLLYGSLLMMCKASKGTKKIKEYISDYEKKYPGWEKSSVIDSIGKGKRLFLSFAKKRCVLGMRMLGLAHDIILRVGA